MEKDEFERRLPKGSVFTIISFEFDDERAYAMQDFGSGNLPSSVKEIIPYWNFSYFAHRHEGSTIIPVFSLGTYCEPEQLGTVEELAVITIQNLLDIHSLSDVEITRAEHKHIVLGANTNTEDIEDIEDNRVDITIEARAIAAAFKKVVN